MIPHEISMERSDERSAPSRTYVLTCPRCRSPVALGFTNQTECQKCHERVAIPESVALRRDNFRKLEAERRQKDPLWALALRARQHFYLNPKLLASLSYFAPFVGIMVGYVFAYRFGNYPLAALLWLWVIGAIHLLSSWLLIQRKPLHVRQLMLAQPASEPGHAPQCRVCSSPLSIPAHVPEMATSLDCSCDHCGADNIIGDLPLVTPRPDLYSIQSAYQEVFGGLMQQRMDRAYPFILLVGFLLLGGISFFVVQVPQLPIT